MADPRYKFQIPLASIDKFCAHSRYQATVPNPGIPGATMPNPETKIQFVGRRIQEYINGTIGAGAIEASINTRKAEDDAARTAALILPVEIT